MIEQGGVKVNGEKVADKGLRLAAGGDLCAPGREAQVRPGEPSRRALIGSGWSCLTGAGKRAIIAVFSPLPQAGIGRVAKALFNKLQPIEVGAVGARGHACWGGRISILQFSLWNPCDSFVSFDGLN